VICPARRLILGAANPLRSFCRVPPKPAYNPSRRADDAEAACQCYDAAALFEIAPRAAERALTTLATRWLKPWRLVIAVLYRKRPRETH
jgi:hypothetical protein